MTSDPLVVSISSLEMEYVSLTATLNHETMTVTIVNSVVNIDSMS